MKIISLNKQEGFTLIEVIVSILLFVIGILGMMGLQVLATRGAVIGSNNTTANYLSQSLAAELGQLPVTAQALKEGTHGYGSSSDACLLCNNCNQRIDEMGYCVADQANQYNIANNVYTINWVVAGVTSSSPVGGSSGTPNHLSIVIYVKWGANGSFMFKVPSGHY